MPIQDRLAQVAIAKQTSLASPAASGDFQIGVSSGQIASLEIPEESFDQSWSTRLSEGHDRSSVTPGVDFETLGMPRSIGLLLLAALGSVNTTGGGPYEHIFTHANVLPYLTVYSRKDTEYHRIGDVRVNDLEISWEATKAVKVKVNGVGCSIEFLGNTPYAVASGGDERPSSSVLKGAGGTFTIDGAAATVKSGSIKISNGVSAVHGSDSHLPKDVFPEMVEVSVSLTIVPTDTKLFRKVVTGSDGGSAVQTNPQYGAVVAAFTDGTNTLTFTGRNVKFMTAFPDTKAQGGPVEVSLEGDCAEKAGLGDPPFEFKLVNSVSSY